MPDFGLGNAQTFHQVFRRGPRYGDNQVGFANGLPRPYPLHHQGIVRRCVREAQPSQIVDRDDLNCLAGKPSRQQGVRSPEYIDVVF